MEVGNAITFAENRLAILDHQHRAAGVAWVGGFCEDGVDLCSGNLGGGSHRNDEKQYERQGFVTDGMYHLLALGILWRVHALASCSVTSGSPAACHASKPPMTLITLRYPARSSRLQAIMLRYPLLQWTASG